VITVQGLSKNFGGQSLFEDVDLQLVPNHRYGLVGANGCGKSTLAKILAGLEPASSGTVGIPKNVRLGMLRQDRFESDEQAIVDVAMMGELEVYNALKKREVLLENAEAKFDAAAYTELEDVIARFDGYALESRAGEILEGLGIASRYHKDPLSTLSGGFKLRVLLAQALAADPDLLVLDEPNNHLDIISIKWLEDFLQKYRGCALIVSHDKLFLNAICTDILDVDYGTITPYVGNYVSFEVQKVEERARRESDIAKREKEIAHLKTFVDRFKAKASKARQAQSRQKQMDKIIIDPLASSSRRYPHFEFPQERPSGREVLTVKNIGKSYGPKRVLEKVSLHIRRGERIGIIGANGIGKSTLLKVITENIAPDEGSFEWGHETHLGYFAQDHKDAFSSETDTVQGFLWQCCLQESMGFVRSHLARVLFSKDDVDKSIKSLSGGECARLLFARMAIQKPNVIILDEPTNHLDLESIESLIEALKAAEGTLIFVSHDRWFVESLASRILEVTPDGIKDYPGTYAEYLAAHGKDHLDAQAAIDAQRTPKKEKVKSAPAKATSTLSKAKRKQLEKERDASTEKIEVNEAEMAKIHALYADADFYMTTAQDEIQRLEKKVRQLEEENEKAMARWEEIELQLDD